MLMTMKRTMKNGLKGIHRIVGCIRCQSIHCRRFRKQEQTAQRLRIHEQPARPRSLTPYHQTKMTKQLIVVVLVEIINLSNHNNMYKILKLIIIEGIIVCRHPYYTLEKAEEFHLTHKVHDLI
jgi:hypothetical protein